MRNLVGFLALALGCGSAATPTHDSADAIASGPDGAVDAALLDAGSKNDGAGAVAPGPDGAVDAALSDARSLPTGACRSWEDCRPPNHICREPAVGPYRGGGGDAFSCRQECDSDQHCVERNALGYKSCVTNPVGSQCRTCQPDCTRLACDMGQSCQPDGHCVPTPCRLDGDCLPNFTCSAQGACARLRCRGDGECQGTCVNGACYATPGACTPPAP